METIVVNIKEDDYDVYIGRSSKWGNPYIINEHGTRSEVIQKYKEYILKSDLMNDLHELVGKRLGCHCKPKRCHGDILKELVDTMEDREILNSL
jgi:hypothetical protein